MNKIVTVRNILAFGVGCFVLVGFMVSSSVYSHCQIPCGIYDDDMRFNMMAEHIKTIEKSMSEIIEISAKSAPDNNQLVRWIQNKDHHADELSEIITYYFLTQRVKPVEKSDSSAYRNYVAELTTLHSALVLTMKCKQTTDLALIGQLTDTIVNYKQIYKMNRIKKTD